MAAFGRLGRPSEGGRNRPPQLSSVLGLARPLDGASQRCQFCVPRQLLDLLPCWPRDLSTPTDGCHGRAACPGPRGCVRAGFRPSGGLSPAVDGRCDGRRVPGALLDVTLLLGHRVQARAQVVEDVPSGRRNLHRHGPEHMKRGTNPARFENLLTNLIRLARTPTAAFVRSDDSPPAGNDPVPDQAD